MKSISLFVKTSMIALVLTSGGTAWAISDTVPPLVGGVTPTSVTSGIPVTLTAHYDDPTPSSGIAQCQLVQDGSTVLGDMTLSSNPQTGDATFTKTYDTPGTHTLQAQCRDGQNNWGYGTVTTITIPTPGTVTAITPTTAVQNAPTTFSASYSGFNAPFTVLGCWLVVDGGTVYPGMDLSTGASSTSGVASKSYTFTTTGSHAMFVSCLENNGGTYRQGPSTTINVTAPSSDTTPPSVGIIPQTSATVGTAMTLTAPYSDNVGVTNCDLIVNGANQGSMTLSGGTALRSFTFASAGTYPAFAQCRDAAGNITSGSVQSIVASASIPGLPAPGTLIKLHCLAGAGVNDPCKAVYYLGSDGKRHAFPNEKVYFTWYSDFSRVVEVSNTAMASVSLGHNVTYRPGIKMVKFTTLNKVYAVARTGELRWVTSESIAQSLYGTNWNRNIDDISDAFFTDYHFGADILSASQYSPSAQTASVTTVDQNF